MSSRRRPYAGSRHRRPLPSPVPRMRRKRNAAPRYARCFASPMSPRRPWYERSFRGFPPPSLTPASQMRPMSGPRANRYLAARFDHHPEYARPRETLRPRNPVRMSETPPSTTRRTRGIPVASRFARRLRCVELHRPRLQPNPIAPSRMRPIANRGSRRWSAFSSCLRNRLYAERFPWRQPPNPVPQSETLPNARPSLYRSPVGSTGSAADPVKRPVLPRSPGSRPVLRLLCPRMILHSPCSLVSDQPEVLMPLFDLKLIRLAALTFSLVPSARERSRS